MVFIPWETYDYFLFDRDYHRLKAKLRVIQAMTSRQTDTWGSFGGMDIDRIFHLSPDNEETYDESEGENTSEHIFSP